MTGFVLTLAVTTLAVFERVAQVASAKLALPFVGVLFGLLFGWAAVLVLLVRSRHRLTAVAHRWPRATISFALSIWVIAMLGFAWVYPVVDSGRLGFESDREEAIDVAVRALARGEFPYACRAVSGIHDGCPESGNPIGPWPGAFLLAAPVVGILGGAGWLSLLSLPLVAVVLARVTRDPPGAVVAVAVLAVAAPVIPAEIITGGDLLANALLVLCPLLLLLEDPRRRGAAGLAIWLGVALSWRALLWMVVPAVLASLLACRRYGDLFRTTMTALAAFLVVTLPLVLWRPDKFTPWGVQQRLSLFTDLLPHANLLFPLLGGIAGAVLGWRARSPHAVLNACGWAVLIPVLGAIMLYSIREGYPTCSFYGWYALAALPPFAIATFRRADGGEPSAEGPALATAGNFPTR
jgi:hypothetical protein